MDRSTFDRLVAGTLVTVANNLKKAHPAIDWQRNCETDLYTAYEEQRRLIRAQMALS